MSDETAQSAAEFEADREDKQYPILTEDQIRRLAQAPGGGKYTPPEDLSLETVQSLNHSALRVVTPSGELVVEFRGNGDIEIGDLDHEELVEALREAFRPLRNEQILATHPSVTCTCGKSIHFQGIEEAVAEVKTELDSLRIKLHALADSYRQNGVEGGGAEWFVIARQIRELIPEDKPVCNHQWVDVHGDFVEGRYCRECGAIGKLGSDEEIFNSTPYQHLWDGDRNSYDV